MAKKATATEDAPLPEHVEEFLALLEAQALAGEDLDRVTILRAVEKKYATLIDIDAELKEHPAAKARFNRVWRRVTMGLEDSTINAARGGRGSAAALLRGLGAMTTSAGNRAEAGRVQLGREHKVRVAGYGEGW